MRLRGRVFEPRRGRVRSRRWPGRTTPRHADWLESAAAGNLL